VGPPYECSVYAGLAEPGLPNDVGTVSPAALTRGLGQPSPAPAGAYDQTLPAFPRLHDPVHLTLAPNVVLKLGDQCQDTMTSFPVRELN
jgi:hypothetical protein